MTRMLITMRARRWFNFPERQLTAQPSRGRAPHADAESPRPDQPERRLLVALLTTSVLDLTSTRPDRDTDAAELRELARLWIAGDAAPISLADSGPIRDLPSPTPACSGYPPTQPSKRLRIHLEVPVTMPA